MPQLHHVVIVAHNPALATALRSWLGSAGYKLSIVTTYSAAKVLLDTGPALIISELKLGENNGLHLALKARHSGIPAIVIGPDDPVLKKDADELGAAYLTSVLRRRGLVDLVKERLDVATSSVPVPRNPIWQFDQISRFQAVGQRRRLLH